MTATGRGPESTWLRAVLLFVVAIVFATLVVVVTLTAGGARLGAATLGLGGVSVTLVFALWAMFGIVRALLRPTAALTLELETDLGTPLSRLREEKQRVLRALKELEFDFAMGKLSETDYQAIADHYKLRAVTVMRRLEGGERHPEVTRLLEKVEEAPAKVEEVPVAVEAAGCGACGRTNDPDARFCKHCGAALVQAAEEASA